MPRTLSLILTCVLACFLERERETLSRQGEGVKTPSQALSTTALADAGY